MEWQIYWPSWWKLWPHYEKTTEWWGQLIGYVETTWFSIGPLQMRWYSRIING